MVANPHYLVLELAAQAFVEATDLPPHCRRPDGVGQSGDRVASGNHRSRSARRIQSPLAGRRRPVHVSRTTSDSPPASAAAISGREVIQAQKFGARIDSPTRPVGVDATPGRLRVLLDDATAIDTRAIAHCHRSALSLTATGTVGALRRTRNLIRRNRPGGKNLQRIPSRGHRRSGLRGPGRMHGTDGTGASANC